MRRMAPSERVRGQVQKLFTGVLDRDANIASERMQGLQMLVKPGGP